MGTKKGQRRKTARRAYMREQRRVGSGEVTPKRRYRRAKRRGRTQNITGRFDQWLRPLFRIFD